jgi:23S rRNA pseudouridine1911/1915/1917 synthase
VNIPILYEDQWLLIVDKPAGLLTVPTPQGERRTLTSILNDDAVQRREGYRLYPCHRLDRETSGVIIYAKGAQARDKMADAFRKRAVEKEYTAFAHGRVFPGEGTVRVPIDGEQALTAYRVVDAGDAFSVVDIQPRTGRTNQIRIHFKHIGHPLVGESRFAFRKDFALKAKRAFLHARSVSFSHPCTGEVLNVSADLPADMRQFLEKHARLT